MALVQLKDLRTRTRQRADMVYSQFVSDAELNNYLNDALKELYDLLIQANVDYYQETLNFTIAAASLPIPFQYAQRYTSFEVWTLT